MTLYTVLFVLAYLLDVTCSASLRLANYYGDHMVLQMAPQRANLWGYAKIGSQVNITFKEKVYTTTAEESLGAGLWQVYLDPVPAGGPFTIQLVATDSEGSQEELALSDVLFGDVWLCSGQSNMAFTVKQVFNATEELQAALQYTNIRLFSVNLTESDAAKYDVVTWENWSLPSPTSLGNGNFTYFSAVCWFYGRNLYDHLKYPIGLLASEWGGTSVEAWSSPDALSTCNITQKDIDSNWQSYKKTEEAGLDYLTGPKEASVLWNAMIHPLLNLTIKGAIWYQGEANTTPEGTKTYNCTFPAMIDDWRLKFHLGSGGETDPTFPFGFVQLAAYTEMPTYRDAYPIVRWHQTADYGFVPNPRLKEVFMAVAVDLPDFDSPYHCIHPRDKQDVGYRLAVAGRAVAYGESWLPRGPFPTAFRNITSQSMVIEYDSSLTVVSKLGFEVCCTTQETCDFYWTWNEALIMGQPDSYSVQLLFNCEYNQPVVVRYNWHESPCPFKQCALYSALDTNMPAPEFLKNL